MTASAPRDAPHSGQSISPADGSAGLSSSSISGTGFLGGGIGSGALIGSGSGILGGGGGTSGGLGGMGRGVGMGGGLNSSLRGASFLTGLFKENALDADLKKLEETSVTLVDGPLNLQN